MSTARFLKSAHQVATGHPGSSQPQGHSTRTRRSPRHVTPAGDYGPPSLQLAPITAGDPVSIADAVLELLRAVNRNHVD